MKKDSIRILFLKKLEVKPHINIMAQKQDFRNVVSGQKVICSFENREFDLLVIDPKGINGHMPSLGVGFRMIDRHSGIPHSTLTLWIEGGLNNDDEWLKSPSGKRYRVVRILGVDNNWYKVLEVADWVELIGDILKNPGKTSKATKEKLINFLTWFAVSGLYSSAYTQLNGAYTDYHRRQLESWQNFRNLGKEKRKDYTDTLKLAGCQNYDYAFWTDYTYKGLFGITAREMKQIWECVDGNEHIARNYISEEEGLKAVAFVERQVAQLYLNDGELKEPHNIGIIYAKRKFNIK